jgi:cytochrome c-type biogenesis protein CcmH
MTSTPLFWLFALALAAVTLAALVLPLLRRHGALPPEEESAAAAIFRDHRRQVEADFTAGTITAAERDAALEDLVGRFGVELAAAPESAARPRSDRPQWISAIVIVAVLPILAGGLYFVLGNPQAINAPKSSPEALADDPQIVAMVDALAKRLKENPDDGNGWAMLGRSYRALGRFEASALAFGEAARRLPPNAAVLTDWAESIAQVQGRSLAGEPTELLQRALALDPKYQKALAMSGAAAMERNDPATAVAMWKRLKATLPPDTPETAQIDKVLAQLEAAHAAGAPAAAAKGNPAPAAGAAAATKSAPMANAAPAAKPGPMANAAPGTGAASAGQSVEGRVEVDPKLAARVAPGDTVFIFARDPDGSRMPLAALKLSAGELPKAFALTDAMAMSAATTISAAKRVVIEARISKTGEATLKSGDLAGTSAPVAPGARDVRIVIDRVNP